MTTQTIQLEKESSRGANWSSEAHRFIQNLNKGSAIFIHGLDLPKSANSELVKLIDVALVHYSARVDNYADFDLLVSEAEADPNTREELRRGREWVANTFGNGDLASLRLSAGLSQRELAALCGIAQPHVSRYESGLQEPRVSTAGKMARALGVSIEALLGAWNVSRASGEQVSE